MLKSVLRSFALLMLLATTCPNAAAAHRAASHVPASRPAIAERAAASFRLGQTGEVTLYRPDGPVRGVVLFLSGDGGWNLGVIDMANALKRQGVAVAGISTPAFLKALESDKDKCLNPNFALLALAQDVEHKLGLKQYIKPILAGYSSGATLVYGALALAPPGIYGGGLSLGFGPDIQGTKPWCTAPGFSASRILKPEAGWLLKPVPALPARWLVLQGLSDQVVDPGTTRQFTAAVPQAELIELPRVGHGFSVQANWLPQMSRSFAGLLAAPETAVARPANWTSVLPSDLPLTMVEDANAPKTDLMAVIYSGDGGWAGLDRDIASQLARSGVPVVGIDSLQYFWNAHDPKEAGRDAGAIIRHFTNAWKRRRVLMIGYSFGADTLPFIVEALPADARAAVARVSLLGLSATADFQFHLSSWLDISGRNALPTGPAVERLRGTPVQCIRGAEENSSACPSLAPGAAQQVLVPGGHRFGGNASLLAQTILRGVEK